MKTFSLPFLLSVGVMSAAILVDTSPAALGQNRPNVSNFANTSTETAYTLGPGDRVKVDLFNVPEYSGEYLILVDGTLSLPVLGSINVNNLTLRELTSILTQGYGIYVKRPIVSVSLSSPRPITISLSGEISKPGTYTLSASTTQEQGRSSGNSGGLRFPTVTDIIQQAGGLTTNAAVESVQIRRFFQGQERMVIVDLWDLFSNGNLKQNVTLRDGDQIVVPTSPRVDERQLQQLADATFGVRSTQPLSVAVAGEIKRPGSYVMEPKTNGLPPRLSEVLKQAGGIKPLADIRNLEVRRITRQGRDNVMKVNFWDLLQGKDPGADIFLQNGDTITIPTAETIDITEAQTIASANFSPDIISVDVVGEVDKPGTIELDPNTPLNQALLAAGGFDENRANRKTVELIRLNPNGTVMTKNIDIDFSAGIDPEANPILLQNDVVVVSRSGSTKAVDSLDKFINPISRVFSILNILNLI